MRFSPLASLLFLYSCQEVQRGPAAVSSFNTNDPKQKELSGFVDRFYSKMASAGYDNYARDIKFIFSYGMANDKVATCSFPTSNTNSSIITINMSYWESWTSADKESTIFHEMGHCVLLRDHTSALISGTSVPISLMNPYIVRASTYIPRRTYYIAELFSQAKIPRTGNPGTGFQAAKNKSFSYQIVESYEDDERVPHRTVDCDLGH